MLVLLVILHSGEKVVGTQSDPAFEAPAAHSLLENDWARLDGTIEENEHEPVAGWKLEEHSHFEWKTRSSKKGTRRSWKLGRS